MAIESPCLRRRRGSVLVEFALLSGFFFLFVLLVMEVARFTYLWNTVQQVTWRAARAAAITDFSDQAAMGALRQRALLRNGPGELPLSGGIVAAHIRIDYLSASAAGVLQPVAPMPADPGANLAICVNDPHAAGCIRFVRARLCTPAQDDSCAPVPYAPMLNLLAAGGITLAPAAVVARAESLGYRPGLFP